MSIPISQAATRSAGPQNCAPPDSPREPEEPEWGHNPPKEEIETLASRWELNTDKIIIEMDGNAWCAHRDDFINLQESISGWGDTPEEALISLLKEETFENQVKPHASHVATTIQDGIRAFVEGEKSGK